jgi:hypothetical protein
MSAGAHSIATAVYSYSSIGILAFFEDGAALLSKVTYPYYEAVSEEEEGA